MHNSWHYEGLLNYHITIVFGGGKNFLCVMIFVMDNFGLSCSRVTSYVSHFRLPLSFAEINAQQLAL